MTHSLDLAAFRILDASANRAAEGLRTIEEYARFLLDDRFLSETAKTLRHDLRSVLATLPQKSLLAARSVSSDCGTTIEVAEEVNRADSGAVLQAAAGRVQEAVRCIEEYGKTISTFDSRKVESLRYRIYTLCATMTLIPGRVDRLRNAKLYVLIDTTLEPAAFANRIELLFSSGVDIVQIRDKQVADRQLYLYSKIASDLARRLGKCLIVNDRPDIAAVCHATGVHLGQDELPVEAARRIVGPDSLIGVSTHSVTQARQAVLDGADYIGCGPTFPSQTKAFAEFPGLAFLREIAAEITLPAYAIGGICNENLAEVIKTDVHGAAVSSGILNAPDLAKESQWFRQQFTNREISRSTAASAG